MFLFPWLDPTWNIVALGPQQRVARTFVFSSPYYFVSVFVYKGEVEASVSYKNTTS